MENKDKKTVIDYFKYASEPVDQVLESLQSSWQGFTNEEADRIRERDGSNELDYGDELPLWRMIIEAYFTPFTLVLIGLAIISFITEYVLAAPGEKDLFSVLIILGLVIISGSMTFYQTYSSNNAAEQLKNLVKVTVAVKRNGKYQEIPMEDVVRGDLIDLSAGDMIPADMRLIDTKDLFISQASLTGESYPEEKFSQADVQEVDTATSYETLAFMGSDVISGAAEGVVIATGDDTLFGDVAKAVTAVREKTSFDEGIEKTSRLLIRFMAVMAPAVILINGFSTGDWMQAVLFGISVAVGLTPEMLPMIVTSNLVKGANQMAKEGTIIKAIDSIQNFGAIDVLCTDKTGTLTQDKIVLEYHWNLDGEEDPRILRHAYLNSQYQTGLKNLLDLAIIDAAKKEMDVDALAQEKVDEIPFDFERRRMSVVMKNQEGKTQLITKGAIEEMLEISSYVDHGGVVTPLTEEAKKKVLETSDELNSNGMRVLGIAHKTNPPVEGEFGVQDESDMVLLGYLAFLDPPKESTAEALQALKDHNVEVKVITGDNILVTRSVASQVGIDASSYVSGDEIDNLTYEEMSDLVERENIFVKINPEQKARIVRHLRENDHVVGFLGDGINDAPALRAADVGISVDTAVDLAKESADVILLEKDLMVLEEGILSGREVFGNIMKYIKATTSSNFGNMFSVLAASIFLPFLPMLPIQLLFLNLIYDISCMSIPWDHMDPEYLEEPKKWDASTINNFMIWFGPTSSIFDMTTFLLMFYVISPQVAGGQFHTLDAAGQAIFIAIFHTGWFIVSLWSQTLVLHALRTPKLPFVQSHPSFIMMTITTLGIIVGTILPYTSLGVSIGLLPLPGNYWFWLVLTIAAYLILVTFVKNAYIKRYGELL